MILLKRILEQAVNSKQNKPKQSKKLNVLFVGDADTAATFSYARDILKSNEVIGKVSAANTGINQFSGLLRLPETEKYDVICIMFSNIIPGKTTREEEVLQQIYTDAKNTGATLIAITPTTKEFVPYGHVTHENNENIVEWVLQQNVADHVVNAYKSTRKKDFFEKDGLRLNAEGHEIIALQVLRVLNEIDSNVDAMAMEREKRVEREKLRKAKTKKGKPVKKGKKVTEFQLGSKSADLIEIQQLLVKLGYEISPDEVKQGVFGETTETAVKQFQTINDLPVTSRLTAKDIKSIKSADAKRYGLLTYTAKSLTNKPIEEPLDKKSEEDEDEQDNYAAAASVKRHASIPKSSQEFFNQWKSIALQHQKEYGIPASITLAQAAIESGWGKSGLTTKYNNFFGITGDYNGKSVKMKNKNGDLFTWSVYPTPEDSFEDHASLLKRKYKPKTPNPTYIEWAKSLTDGGYAESNYGSKLIKFIKQNGLEDYDTIEPGEITLGSKDISDKLSSQSLLSVPVVIDASGPKNHGNRALGNWQSDNAWDIFAKNGTLVYSITAGTVTKIGGNENKHSGKIFGAQVTVTGTDGYPNIFYTHLTNLQISKGDVVQPGTLIGEITSWDSNHSAEHVHIGLPYGESISSLVDMGTGRIKMKTA